MGSCASAQALIEYCVMEGEKGRWRDGEGELLHISREEEGEWREGETEKKEREGERERKSEREGMGGRRRGVEGERGNGKWATVCSCSRENWGLDVEILE